MYVYIADLDVDMFQPSNIILTNFIFNFMTDSSAHELGGTDPK